MADPTRHELRNQFPDQKHYLPLFEAAAYVHSHPQTLRKAFRLKALGGFRRGRRLYFRAEDLDKWMRGFEQKPSRLNPA